jgi:hypothetical protein
VLTGFVVTLGCEPMRSGARIRAKIHNGTRTTELHKRASHRKCNPSPLKRPRLLPARQLFLSQRQTARAGILICVPIFKIRVGRIHYFLHVLCIWNPFFLNPIIRTNHTASHQKRIFGDRPLPLADTVEDRGRERARCSLLFARHCRRISYSLTPNTRNAKETRPTDTT